MSFPCPFSFREDLKTAIIKIALPGGMWWKMASTCALNASRINRFILFRSTAFPMDLLTAKPICMGDDDLRDSIDTCRKTRDTNPTETRTTSGESRSNRDWMRTLLFSRVYSRLRPVELGLFALSFIANSKLVPTFSSSVLYHLRTAYGRHSFAKTVLIGSLAFTWLIRPFHLNLLFIDPQKRRSLIPKKDRTERYIILR